jgi:hypothetical protein
MAICYTTYMAICYTTYMDIWFTIWTFGIFCGNLVFSPFLVCCTKQNLATLPADSGDTIFPHGNSASASNGSRVLEQ